MRSRSFSELRRLETFEDRFDYLNLIGEVGQATFGHDRYLNQRFYTSRQWRQVRHVVIVRDNGCDLGVEGYELTYDLLIHHMNPISPKDFADGEEWILDPEFLICTSGRTHQAIHFGDRTLLPRPAIAREPGDTLLW
jgi:hypothetical protein